MDVGVFVELEPVGVADTHVGTFVAVYDHNRIPRSHTD